MTHFLTRNFRNWTLFLAMSLILILPTHSQKIDLVEELVGNRGNSAKLAAIDLIRLPDKDTVIEVPLLSPGIIDTKIISKDDFKILQPIKPLIEQSAKYEKAAHVVNGITLRNRTSGTIHLRGVPNGRQVIAAFLYWNILDDQEIGADTFPALFDGNNVIGKKTADSPDPCWSNVIGSHSYVANVTRFVNGTGHPNQDYEVALFFDDLTSTTGQNPWSPVEAQDVRTEGASLIVVFKDEKGGPVYIYDNLNDSMFSGNATFRLSHAAADGPALFSSIGADGQRGSGHNNSAGNELTFFNSSQIAGPPVISSDWDGSDGWPLPQLWDTHTHEVKLAGNIANVQYNAGGDCLVPVAFVIDVQ